MSFEQFTSTKRSRVQGQGPERKLFPCYKFITKAPKQLLDEINNINHVNSYKNDLYGDDYNISKFCDLKKKIPSDHRNFLLQKPNSNSDGLDQKDYTSWGNLKDNSFIRQYLNTFFPNCFRARIATLPPRSEIDWHIDMNTKVALRFHLLIKNPKFIFKIKRKNKIETIPFQEGDFYFTNTAFPHKVYNPSPIERVSLLFDIEYKDVHHYFPEIRIK